MRYQAERHSAHREYQTHPVTLLPRQEIVHISAGPIRIIIGQNQIKSRQRQNKPRVTIIHDSVRQEESVDQGKYEG